jgi:hypothetical protein
MSKGIPRTLARAAASGDSAVVSRLHVKLKHTINVAAAGAGIGFGTVVVGDFPEGNIAMLAVVGNVTFTAPGTSSLIAAFAGDFSVGTAANADTDLADAGEANILASTELLAASSTTGNIRATNVTPLVLDNTDGSLEINLNVIIDASSIADASDEDVAVTGDLYIVYAKLGDD